MNRIEPTRPIESPLQKLEQAVRASGANGRAPEVERTSRDAIEEDDHYANIPCTD